MNTWTEVYTRCMDGEFFRGAACPRDGSSTEASIEVTSLVAAMREESVAPSFEELANRGFSGPFKDVVVAQFASPDDAPEYFRPEYARRSG